MKKGKTEREEKNSENCGISVGRWKVPTTGEVLQERPHSHHHHNIPIKYKTLKNLKLGNSTLKYQFTR